MRSMLYLIFLLPVLGYSQPNCNVFLWEGDTLKYKACQFAEEHARDYYQFDMRQVKLWEEAIAICPRFAFPYREIAAPYVKSGNFIEWKKYIDKAVELAPMDYLSVRASLRYKFFADYQGTLADIALLEELMQGNDIGPTSNGTYHLNTVKGLCLKALGEPEQAIEVMERQLNKENHFISVYDYLHLGVLYLEEGAADKAIELLLKQEAENDLAENRYYIALAYQQLNKEEAYRENIQKALDLYQAGDRMKDSYNELFDQIYLTDIEREMERIK
ncbi:MAG: hypothetical protein AAF798_04840 [Bacteroidota bacterium]